MGGQEPWRGPGPGECHIVSQLVSAVCGTGVSAVSEHRGEAGSRRGCGSGGAGAALRSRPAGGAGASPAGPPLSPSRSLLLPAGVAVSLPSLGMLLLLVLQDPNPGE